MNLLIIISLLVFKLVFALHFQTGIENGNTKPNFIKNVNNNNKDALNKEPFTFDDMFSGKFIPKSYSIAWIDEKRYIRMDENNTVRVYDVDSNENNVLFTGSLYVCIMHNIFIYYFSLFLTYISLSEENIRFKKTVHNRYRTNK